MLVVTRPFAGHARGDVITDAAAASAVLAGDFRDHVVAVASPAVAPAAAPTLAQAIADGVAAAEAALHPKA